MDKVEKLSDYFKSCGWDMKIENGVVLVDRKDGEGYIWEGELDHWYVNGETFGYIAGGSHK